MAVTGIASGVNAPGRQVNIYAPLARVVTIFVFHSILNASPLHASENILESSYQKTTREVVVIGIMTLLVSISEFMILPLLTKTLGVQDYGIWSQIMVTIGIIVPIASLGLPFAMVRFLAAEKNKREIQGGFYSIVAVVFISNLVISSVLIIFPGFIADYFFGGASQVVRIAGLISLAFALNGVYLAFFRTFRRIKTYAVLNIARAYAEIGLIAYLVLSGHGILSTVLALLAIRSALFLITFIFITLEIRIKKPNISRVKEYLRFSLPTIAVSIADWVVTLSARYVIAYFLGVASVGIYSAGYMVANACLLLANILGFVLPAALSQLYDKKRIEEVKTHLKYSLKYTLALAIPFVFGAAMLSEPVLAMFSTAAIASQGKWVTSIIALGFLFMNVATVPWLILVLVKKTKIIAAALGASAFVNLLLNILVVPHLGIVGAAIATMIAYLLQLLIQGYYAFKELRFDIEWQFIIKSLLASTIMSLAIWAIHPQGTLATILTVLAGIAVYGVSIFIMRGFRKKEISFFMGLFRPSPPIPEPSDRAR